VQRIVIEWSRQVKRGLCRLAIKTKEAELRTRYPIIVHTAGGSIGARD